MTNFWQGLDQFNQKKLNPIEIEFRLYYDQCGYPLFYTTEKVDGNFIIVDHETYTRGDYQNIKVKNRRITQRNPLDSMKLVKDESEGTCCLSNDVSLIDNTKKGQYWKLKTHEYS